MRKVVAVAGLGVWNVVVNHVVHDRWYVPANLAVAGALLRLAGAREGRRLGTSGLVWGLGGAAVAGGAVVVASRLRSTQSLFDDARVHDDDVAYQALVRIPLGTVVLEEVAFRDVLPRWFDGAARRRPSLGAAGLFGLWHIVPTLKTLDINGVVDPRQRWRAVVVGVAATAAAGWMLDAVRIRSRSVVAPMLIHWSVNATSYVVAARR